MYDQLPILLELQKIDNEIDKIERQKAFGPARVKELDAEIEKYRLVFESKNSAFEELQKQRREKDRKLQLQQSQLQKYKSQRNSVKTNKEYTALEFQISELEDANSKIEDEIIELMINIDKTNDELDQARKEMEAQENILKKKKEEILSEIKELDRQIGEWNNKRVDFVGKISSSLMIRYENWRKRRGGSLVSVIEGQVCGSCRLTLPPQLINEVRKKERLYTCNSCGRILYWKDEDKSGEE